jgi:hypothetical protein
MCSLISGNGPNALDFHIAYYVGEISQKDPDAYFHIISKDTGFDPLIQHLRKRGIKIHRERDIGEIPVLKVSSSTTDTEKLSDQELGKLIDQMTSTGKILVSEGNVSYRLKS